MYFTFTHIYYFWHFPLCCVDPHFHMVSFGSSESNFAWRTSFHISFRPVILSFIKIPVLNFLIFCLKKIVLFPLNFSYWGKTYWVGQKIHLDFCVRSGLYNFLIRNSMSLYWFFFCKKYLFFSLAAFNVFSVSVVSEILL